jgi:MYXO-CTERM domain-containing protein
VVRQLKVVVSSWVLGALLLAAPAFADIAPADACMMADEGEACDNAGENADQPGVCQKDSCTKQTPDGEMTYDCYLCQAAEAGGGGQGNTTGDAGATSQGGTNGGSTSSGGSTNTAGTTADDTSDEKDDAEGGCSVSPAPVAGLAGLLAPLLAFGLAAARRRRSPR